MPALPLLRPSPRTLLRPLALADAAPLFAAYGDDEVCTYWARPAYASVDETTDAVRWEIENGMSWAVVDAARGEQSAAVGRVSLFRQRAGVLEVGIIFARAAWGRGFAGDALEAAVQHGFATGAHRIFADIDPDNVPSLKLFERAGFVREGLLRKAWRTHLGLRDSVILGRLAPEVEAGG
jgi:[ribosomal protein S5]-alanine N-acetyltransferase